jgi:hypothetical protein
VREQLEESMARQPPLPNRREIDEDVLSGDEEFEWETQEADLGMDMGHRRDDHREEFADEIDEDEFYEHKYDENLDFVDGQDSERGVYLDDLEGQGLDTEEIVEDEEHYEDSYDDETPAGPLHNDMNVEEFDADFDDDFENDAGAMNIGPGVGLAPTGKEIDLKQAQRLRRLVFGHDNLNVPHLAPWKSQGFFFAKSLPFGLVQKDGGPCGVLAAVQAFVLKFLIFQRNGKDAASGSFSDWQQPSAPMQQQAVVDAIGSMLWRAGCSHGGKDACVLAIVGGGDANAVHWYTPDGVTERLRCFEFTSRQALVGQINACYNQFSSRDGYGVLLLVYSLILSYGIENVEADMAPMAGFGEGTPALIGAHGYANQELVNLMLAGVAHANVFNGVKTLDEGNGEEGSGMVLQGVKERQDIGFLSLFEVYRYISVGTFLKCPSYPLWVICSESHYSVCFCDTRPADAVEAASRGGSVWQPERDVDQFDVHYYDMLAQQHEPIRLTITPRTKGGGNAQNGGDDDDLVPPIEKCLRTRWKGCEVDWNGTEPLL